MPEELKVALERAAARGRSEAELIREVVRDLTGDIERPKPKLPLFSSGDPTLAERFRTIIILHNGGMLAAMDSDTRLRDVAKSILQG